MVKYRSYIVEDRLEYYEPGKNIAFKIITYVCAKKNHKAS